MNLTPRFKMNIKQIFFAVFLAIVLLINSIYSLKILFNKFSYFQLNGLNYEESKASIYNYKKEIIFLYLGLIIFGILLVILFVSLAHTNNKILKKMYSDNEINRSDNDDTRLQLEESEIRYKDLVTLDEAKDLFVSTVTHELRTPLTSIIGYVEILKSELSGESNTAIKKSLEVLDRNSLVLLRLIESTLSLSVMEAEQKTVQSRVDLLSILDNAIYVLTPQIRDTEIIISVDADSSLSYCVQGNESHLNQALLNILSNAAKFSRNGQEIKVYLFPQQLSNGSWKIVLKIQDFGIGIPQPDQAKLFTKFFRAQNAIANQIQGTGLGLSIVERIMKLHQGEILVESTEGSGTTITLILPRYLTAAEELVANNRMEVLRRAIDELSATDVTLLDQCAHNLGGSLSFYEFPIESKYLLDLSEKFREENRLPKHEKEEMRLEAITLMKNRLNLTTEEATNEK